MTDRRELSALGPFFAADFLDEDRPPGPPWRPLRELGDDPAALRRRVDAVHAALVGRAVEQDSAAQRRITASAAQLGLVARVLAPAIGAAALGLGRVPLGPDDAWWQDRLGGPFPLLLRPPERSGHRREHVAGTVLGSVVDVVTTAVATRYRVSRHVVWGNVASAANTAALLVATARPAAAARAAAAADLVLADPRIEGGRLRSGPAFRRHSCCLMYAAVGGSGRTCDDCVLRR